VLLARSVLDEAWTNDVRQFAGRPILFVAEGLLPYFTEAQHKLVFGYLAGHFPGQRMLFQTSAPSLTRELIPSSDLAKLRTSAELQWGLEDSAQISALDPRVHLLDDFPLLAGHEHELPQELRQRWSPEQLRRVATIVHVRFDYGACGPSEALTAVLPGSRNLSRLPRRTARWGKAAGPAAGCRKGGGPPGDPAPQKSHAARYSLGGSTIGGRIQPAACKPQAAGVAGRRLLATTHEAKTCPATALWSLCCCR
jgi:hypothetical protein